MKFYLIRPKESKSSIYVDINYKRYRVRTSTGIIINSKSWDSSKELVKRNGKDYSFINNTLKMLRANIDSFISDLKLNRTSITKNDFVFRIKCILDPDMENVVSDVYVVSDTDSQPLLKNMKNWIEYRRKSGKYAESTLNKYIDTYNNLKDFENKKQVSLTYHSMDDDFYTRYVYHLNKRGLVNNTVGIHIKALKAFLNEQVKLGKLVNMDFKKFKVLKDTHPPTFALTDNEIKAMETVELTNRNHIEARDLFIVQLHTLVRVSDLMKINKEHIDVDNRTIKIFIKKTQTYTTLPITKKAISVFEKYDFKLPRASRQKYNSNLKAIAELAGIDKKVEIIRARGTGKDINIVPKYKVVSSNTVRRSGITGLLRRGLPPETIMQISGHKNLSVFQGYVRMEHQDSVNRVRDAWDSLEEV